MRILSACILMVLAVPYQVFAQGINPASVTIARDSFGVPHIFAKTDAEAAYGLAWAHSEDDFENIQLSMLAASGMLGRVEGLDGVLFDFALQFLSVDSLVEARYETDLSPEFRKVLDGFVQGLNDYAMAHPKEVIRKKLFPITGKTVIKGYVLSTSLMAGLGMALKAARDGEIESYLNINDTGSNALAVSPDKMVDGKGYFLCNSHQPIEGRFAWYEAHVNSEEGWNIVGGLFPGGMSIFVGVNEHLAWAHTTNYHNFGDIYQLEINPKNKHQYKYDGQWRNFYEKKVKLKVKIAGVALPVKRTVQICEYGPVFKTKTGSYAFRFPGYMDIRSAEQWFNMNKAKDLEGFENALRMQAVPLFNVIYADEAGNTMLHSGGRVPHRDPSLSWKYPITSNSSAHKWTDIVPYDGLPHVENPDCGYVFNANNTPLVCTGDDCNWTGNFPGLQQFMYNRGDQFQRYLAEAGDGPFTEEYLYDLKFNTGFAPNGTYMAHFSKMYQLDETKYPDIADAIKKLKNWNLQGNVDSKDATLALVVHDLLRQKADGPFAILMIWDKEVSEEDAVWAIREAKKMLLKGHGTLDVPLGDVQRHMRGDVSLPIGGLREVPKATDSKLIDKKKVIYQNVGGDGYIQIVRFGDNGPEIKTINAYGASGHADSPHYTDQMQMFVNGQFKDMTLNKEVILKSAERVYHPGE